MSTCVVPPEQARRDVIICEASVNTNMSQPPSLYDAHGKLIKRDTGAESPSGKRDSGSTDMPADTPLITEDPRPDKPARNSARILPAWARGWKLFVEIGSLVGLLITLYLLRPVLSVSSFLGTGIDGVYGVKATVADTGSSPITNVLVQCVTNKVIFENRFTLELDKFVSVDEYSVGDVNPGESFTANCTFAWSMWEKSGQEGLLILGHPTPGRPNLGVTFRYVNGTPVPTGQCPTTITIGFEDAIRYQNRKLTAVDGSFVVRYKWRFWPFQQTKIIHMIESPGPEDGIRWRVAPASEPVILDAPPQQDGWKMTAKSNSAQFMLTMKGGTYSPQ